MFTLNNITENIVTHVFMSTMSTANVTNFFLSSVLDWTYVLAYNNVINANKNGNNVISNAIKVLPGLTV
jgi:hypothetical protein